RPRAGDSEGARQGEALARRHRPLRAERGLRRTVARGAERPPDTRREDQRERRSDSPRAPDRRFRDENSRYAPSRDGEAEESQARPRGPLYRRRNGHRDYRRERKELKLRIETSGEGFPALPFFYS